MSIIKKQELPENIELLSAQRSMYSKAKNIMGFQMLLSGPIALSSVILAIFIPDSKGYVALWGVLVLLLDIFIFTPWVKILRENAAKTQELFDTRVFGLDWNEIAVGKKPEPELIHEEAKNHYFSKVKKTSLNKWYPAIINDVPEIFAMIICQRSNLWWDARVRKRYFLFICITLVLIAAGLIGYSIFVRKDVFEFLAFIVAPIASTYVFGYRQMVEQRDTVERLNKLKDASEKIWAEALSGESVSRLRTKCRSLQDQIFDHRKRNPPTFDFLFKWFRDENELLMNKGAEVLVQQYKNSQPN